MPMLSQLLAQPDLGLRLIQAGEGDPEITWSSTTELLDVGGYLEGGEIILTTGLMFGPGDPRWRDFVAGLSRSRVAAIGFGIGVNHDTVPRPLIAAASMYRVALFEIPLPLPFIAVSKAIAALVRGDELRAARDALRTQRRLLDGVQGKQDPADVLASIAQATGRHFALVASDGSVLANTAGYAAAASVGDERIVLDQEESLHLIVAGDAPLTPEGRSVVAAGSMVLGLGLRSDNHEQTRERERWEQLAELLVAGRTTPQSISILAGSLALPERVRVLAVQGSAESMSQWRKRQRTGLDRLIAPELSPASGLAMATQVCPDISAALEQAIDSAAAHDLDLVVGRPAPIAEAARSRRSAITRLRALSTTAPLYVAPRTPQVIWADRDTPILEALLTLGETEHAGITRAADLSLAVLGPLSNRASTSEATPDAAPDREVLRETLRALFEHDGGRGPTATALGIHRNTLRDRLGRVEQLTGRSVANADDRAELWLALRLELVADK